MYFLCRDENPNFLIFNTLARKKNTYRFTPKWSGLKLCLKIFVLGKTEKFSQRKTVFEIVCNAKKDNKAVVRCASAHNVKKCLKNVLCEKSSKLEDVLKLNSSSIKVTPIQASSKTHDAYVYQNLRDKGKKLKAIFKLRDLFGTSGRKFFS